MSWALPEDVEANRAGKLGESQRARLRRALVPTLRGKVGSSAFALVFVTAFAVASGEPLVFTPFLIVGLALVGMLGRQWKQLSDDLAGGVVEAKTAVLGPMSAPTLLAERHSIVVDGIRIQFAHIPAGTEREGFAHGGTFRLFYLPRSKNLVSYAYDAPKTA